MKDKNNLMRQGIKLYCRQYSSLCAVTESSDDHNVLAFCIKYCEILRKITKVAQQQRDSSLEQNEITQWKRTQNYKERDRESTVSAAGSNCTVNYKKISGYERVDNVFCNLFIIIIEKIRHWTNIEGRSYLSSKRYIFWKLPS
jgi:hypothetical protein